VVLGELQMQDADAVGRAVVVMRMGVDATVGAGPRAVRIAALGWP
jgi:hypothetical protein